jgi:hypothetical protein
MLTFKKWAAALYLILIIFYSFNPQTHAQVSSQPWINTKLSADELLWPGKSATR